MWVCFSEMPDPKHEDQANVPIGRKSTLGPCLLDLGLSSLEQGGRSLILKKKITENIVIFQ